MSAHNEQHDPACIAAYEQLFQADSRDPSQAERLGVWVASWNAAQPAQPAAAQEAVAYLDIGAGGYLDIGSDLSDEQLLALPKGRHALAIIGTFGIDGYVAAAPTVTDPVAAYERELAAGAAHEHALHAICTPAAPGIDLPALPDDFSESKDWRAGNYAERIQWLMVMVRSQREHIDALTSAPPGAPVPPNAVAWHPIETAPKDNKRPLYLAQFNTETGDLIDLDWDASWEPESESWEIPQVYYIWRSANGRVEEPTHWAYQDLRQPAAQEAVGWQWRWVDTDNTWSEWVDGGSRKEIDARIARWKADGEDHRMQIRPVFAAPVTAAPADDEFPAFLRDVATAAELVRTGGQSKKLANRLREEVAKRQVPARRKTASTPAAPGIDLRQFRDAVVAWSDKAYEESHAATERDACRWARIAEEHRDGRLAALERVAELEGKLRAAPEWQPMETAPRDGTVVLVAISGSDIPQPCRFRERVGWVIAWDEWRIPAHDGPLGWMPLPVAARPQGVKDD